MTRTQFSGLSEHLFEEYRHNFMQASVFYGAYILYNKYFSLILLTIENYITIVYSYFTIEQYSHPWQEKRK